MTVAQEILREIERELSLKKEVSSESVKVRCHTDVADWLYTEETEAIDKFEGDKQTSVAVKVEPSFHIEQYEINWI